jgi:hypothetical protein
VKHLHTNHLVPFCHHVLDVCSSLDRDASYCGCLAAPEGSKCHKRRMCMVCNRSDDCDGATESDDATVRGCAQKPCSVQRAVKVA